MEDPSGANDAIHCENEQSSSWYSCEQFLALRFPPGLPAPSVGSPRSLEEEMDGDSETESENRDGGFSMEDSVESNIPQVYKDEVIDLQPLAIEAFKQIQHSDNIAEIDRHLFELAYNLLVDDVWLPVTFDVRELVNSTRRARLAAATFESFRYSENVAASSWQPFDEVPVLAVLSKAVHLVMRVLPLEAPAWWSDIVEPDDWESFKTEDFWRWVLRKALYNALAKQTGDACVPHLARFVFCCHPDLGSKVEDKVLSHLKLWLPGGIVCYIAHHWKRRAQEVEGRVLEADDHLAVRCGQNRKSWLVVSVNPQRYPFDVNIYKCNKKLRKSLSFLNQRVMQSLGGVQPELRIPFSAHTRDCTQKNEEYFDDPPSIFFERMLGEFKGETSPKWASISEADLTREVLGVSHHQMAYWLRYVHIVHNKSRGICKLPWIDKYLRDGFLIGELPERIHEATLSTKRQYSRLDH